MAVRRLAVTAAIAVLVLAPAAPAHAGHDSFEPGAVVLDDSRGGRVMVVYPLDADEHEAVAEVEAAAADAGLEIDDPSTVENNDPDTLRVRVQTPVAERTGFLERHIPADRIAAWEGVADDGELYLDLDRWAQVDGMEPGEDGAYAISGEDDISYRISGWALVAPLLVLLAAALVPYAALRAYAAAVTRRGGEAVEQLHRIRRGAAVAQIVVSFALVALLFITGALDWVDLLLAELAPNWAPPAAVAMIAGMLGFLLPFLAAVVATVLAVLPYDRRLRDTDQTARAGASQAIRMVVLVFSPIVVWLALMSVLPDMGGWMFVPVLLLFVVGIGAVQPLLMNAVMDTRPLDEPLRQRVLGLCADHGLKVRDARLLDSRGGKVANAAISGIIPPLRYVYLTDHLIEILDEDEFDAVVAHEIGHGKGHHLPIKLLAGLVALGALGGLVALGGAALLGWVGETVGLLGLILGIPVVTCLALVLAHGVVGVAVEKRADDFAVRVVGARPLADALDKLADANKMKRRTGWLWNVLQQHPGMEQRLTRLRQRSDADEQAMQETA